MSDLLRLPGDEVADGLAEETGQQRVQGWLMVQEVIEDVQQSLVPSEPVVDLRHIRRQQFTGCVGVPAGTEPKPRAWEAAATGAKSPKAAMQRPTRDASSRLQTHPNHLCPEM